MVSKPADRIGRTGPNLSAEVTDAIIDAVLAELADVGYGQLSMDGVARRARAGKSALYRRWPSKQEMVLDAVARVSLPHVALLRTDDLETVVSLMVQSVESWLTDSLTRKVVPDLIAEALRNQGLGEALTDRIGLMRRNYWREELEARVATGEVDAGADIEYALDLLAAPLFWRLCARREDPSDVLRAQTVQTVLNALRPSR